MLTVYEGLGSSWRRNDDVSSLLLCFFLVRRWCRACLSIGSRPARARKRKEEFLTFFSLLPSSFPFLLSFFLSFFPSLPRFPFFASVAIASLVSPSFRYFCLSFILSLFFFFFGFLFCCFFSILQVGTGVHDWEPFVFV